MTSPDSGTALPPIEAIMLDVATQYSGLINCSSALPKTNPRIAVTTLAVIGDLDSHTCRQLTHDLRRCSAMKRPIIVDLTNLWFVSAGGLRVLVRFGSQCHAQGVPLALVSCPSVDRLISLTGIGCPFQRVDSPRAALWRLRGDVLRSGQRPMPLAAPAALQC